MGESDDLRIPADPEERARLANFAGLTDEERLALDKWCDLQAQENKARQRRGLEREGDRPLAGESDDLERGRHPLNLPTCGHWSATGIDQEHGPGKVWRCDGCGWLHTITDDPTRPGISILTATDHQDPV